MPLLRLFRRIPWRIIRTRLVLIGFALVFIVLFPGSTPAGNSLEEKVLGIAKDVLYNYVAWEVDAVLDKIRQVQSGMAPYLTEAQRSQYVQDYLVRVGKLQQLNNQIAALYSNPAITDPQRDSADLRQQRDSVARDVALREPLAESIVESQVAAVLRDEGFDTLGGIWPPVSARITELPMLLVISPRNVIQRELSINLINMSTDEIANLENRIDHTLNVSSIVVPLGGLALYPSMVYQTWDGPNLFEVVAHEWSHHYLLFFPLGLEYMNSSSETWIINESTASLFGKEIGRKTIERYYSDFPDLLRLLPPLEPAVNPAAPPAPTPIAQDPDVPPPFDPGAEMNKARITVDFYLHFGKIELAENYMEAERLVFAAHGFYYRKLNQAYFAFYGGYQSPGGGGTAGSDPIGPAIAEIRRNSPSLKAWLEAMRTITSREQLLGVRDALVHGEPH